MKVDAPKDSVSCNTEGNKAPSSPFAISRPVFGASGKIGIVII